MTTNSEPENPLLSDSPHVWQTLIDSAGPASLLLAIESRMGPLLLRRMAPADILQDALLHAWRDRATCQWRGLRSFRSWLLSIIDNRIHDAADFEGAAKRGGKHAIATLELGSADSHNGQRSFAIPPALMASTTPSRVAMHREQAAAMASALSHLPDDLREVVGLRLIERLTLEQVAQQLSIGIAAARHRFRKGAEIYRMRLQAALGSQSFGRAAEPAPDAPADSSS